MQALLESFTGSLLNFGIAVVILIGGWILALIISAVVKGALSRTSIDNRMAERLGMSQNLNIEQIVGKIVFWFIMLFVLLAVFQFLDLTALTGPLNSLLNEVFAFVPNLLGAAILALVAWVIATILRFGVSKALGATKLDDTLTSQVGLDEGSTTPMSETLANIIYWFIFLLFLPAILDALGMQGLLAPVQSMINDLLGFLPNVLGAGIIAVVGWFVARILRQIVTGLLSAVGADSLGERVGMSADAGSGQTLSNLIGTVVYALVLIPVIISALNALQIEAISGPATNMLNTLMDAIPAIFGAMIVLVVTYFIAKLVAGLVVNVLTAVGFNRVLGLIGLGSEPKEGQTTPADVVGQLVMVGMMLFAAIEAAELLGFGILADLSSQFLAFAGQVLLGIIIFGLGLYLANLARSIILNTAGAQANLLSQVARIAIIVLTAAMGLRQMGIAEDIVNLAFGLTLGAIAIAAALAFGLGAREAAGRELEGWIGKMRSGDGK